MYEVKREIINWLIEENNPPVKYLTLVKILESKESSSEVIEILNKIMTYKPIVEIMQNQKEKTFWFSKAKDQNYKKYLGTYWQLLFLSEMYAQKNKQIENACEHIYSTGQAPNGGFSITGANSGVAMCFTANTLRALIHFGYLEDERTNKAIEYISNNIKEDKIFIPCQMIGLLTNCYMAIPKILFALSLIPKEKRTPKVKQGVNICVKTLLDNQIYKYIPEKNKQWTDYIAGMSFEGKQYYETKKRFLEENPNHPKIAKVSWMKFGFPHSYTSDILDAMRALAFSGVKYSPEMNDALTIIKSRSINGKWFNEKEYKSPMYTTIEPYKIESKWLTLHALIILKHFEGLKMI